jgi:hypothetical protein
MLSDGITERHADEDMVVSDIAQLLLRSVEGRDPADERARDEATKA